MSRVVLDTNVLVSALLLKGKLNKFVDLWKTGIINPVLSKETFSELIAVLSYSKFNLSDYEIKTIMEDEILPFFMVTEIKEEVSGICRDPNDDIFLTAAYNAQASIIVTGDKVLLELKNFTSIRILTPREYLDMIEE
ncbi:MAG: putative toxin-antitoxin system toxin component, PIN family [Deltaproteobacteria bacterium]|nr:putative toxin-antitoxin system toxin component, PIN family [Deltaproteobacteria bacterium]